MTGSEFSAALYWFSLLALGHTWGLYGLILFVWVRCVPPKETSHIARSAATVSVIIAAHNEEKSIRGRLENILALEYDLNRVEVIVASDGSTDGTCAIVREAQADGRALRLLDSPRQRGKAAVQNEAVTQAAGDILVFTDAETRFDERFLQQVVPHFDDPRVAAVSGRIVYLNEGDSSITVSAGLYWRIEERIRTWESQLGLLAFGTGAAFCVRKALYEPIRSNEDIDYALSLRLVARGHRVTYERSALAYDSIASTVHGAHRARVRQTSRAFRSILRHLCKTPAFLKRPTILFSILSHKTLRHMTPVLLIALAVTNLQLWSSGAWYRLTMVGQCTFYFLGLMGWVGQAMGCKPKLLALPFTFLVLNFSRFMGVIVGWLRRPPSAWFRRPPSSCN